MNNEKYMGIIRNPGFGCRDFHSGVVGLWFNVYASEATASLQCFFGDDALKIISAYGAYDVKDLHGRPCWVKDDGAFMKWVGPCVI